MERWRRARGVLREMERLLKFSNPFTDLFASVMYTQAQSLYPHCTQYIGTEWTRKSLLSGGDKHSSTHLILIYAPQHPQQRWSKERQAPLPRKPWAGSRKRQQQILSSPADQWGGLLGWGSPYRCTEPCELSKRKGKSMWHLEQHWEVCVTSKKTKERFLKRILVSVEKSHQICC